MSILEDEVETGSHVPQEVFRSVGIESPRCEIHAKILSAVESYEDRYDVYIEFGFGLRCVANTDFRYGEFELSQEGVEQAIAVCCRDVLMIDKSHLTSCKLKLREYLDECGAKLKGGIERWTMRSWTTSCP